MVLRTRHEGSGKVDPRQAGLGTVSESSITRIIAGSDWAKDTLDAITILMTELKETLSIYDYKYDYIYSRHNVAKLILNAVTVQIDNITSSIDYSGISAGTVTDYMELEGSIRLHTGYVGAAFNYNETLYLVNSIINKLLQNRDAGNDIDIIKINSAEIGAEFYNFTKGAEISVTLAVPVDHAQEV